MSLKQRIKEGLKKRLAEHRQLKEIAKRASRNELIRQKKIQSRLKVAKKFQKGISDIKLRKDIERRLAMKEKQKFKKETLRKEIEKKIIRERIKSQKQFAKERVRKGLKRKARKGELIPLEYQ